MDVKGFIIALMAFVLVGSISLLLVTDLYSEENLDVNLSADRDTSAIEELRVKFDEDRADLQEYNSEIEGKVLSNLTFKKDITSGDLLGAGWNSFTSIPKYIGTFFSTISLVSSNILGATAIQYFLWFFIGVVVITLAIMIVNAILGSNL